MGKKKARYLALKGLQALSQAGLDEEVEKGIARVEAEGTKGKDQRG